MSPNSVAFWMRTAVPWSKQSRWGIFCHEENCELVFLFLCCRLIESHMFRCLFVAFPLEFSLFVKLLAIPALSHDDYAAAQRVEIVASQKYSVVLEATCNLLFGIKSCSCRICIVHVAKDLKDQFWSNVIVHGLIPSRRGDIGFCWNVEVAPASGDLTNLPRWF